MAFFACLVLTVVHGEVYSIAFKSCMCSCFFCKCGSSPIIKSLLLLSEGDERKNHQLSAKALQTVKQAYTNYFNNLNQRKY